MVLSLSLLVLAPSDKLSGKGKLAWLLRKQKSRQFAFVRRQRLYQSPIHTSRSPSNRASINAPVP
jgi:hypothetical protein